jgi:hypothetical protein
MALLAVPAADLEVAMMIHMDPLAVLAADSVEVMIHMAPLAAQEGVIHMDPPNAPATTTPHTVPPGALAALQEADTAAAVTTASARLVKLEVV